MSRIDLTVGMLATVLAAGCVTATPAAPVTTGDPSSALVQEPSPTPDRSPAATEPSMPAAAATPNPQPAWTHDVDTLAWHRLGTIPANVSGVVGFRNGYVALAYDGERVFVSEDGASWKKIGLRHPGGNDATGQVGRALATDGSSVLVVGGFSHEPCEALEPGQEPDTGGGPGCDYSPVTWISNDGVHWKASLPDAGTAEFVAAWPVAGGGWESAASEWSGEALGGRELWHSDDGKSWARQKAAPPAPWEGYDPTVPFGLGSDSGRSFLAASERGTSFETTLATRTGGGTWRVVRGFPGSGALVNAGTAPAGEDERWVLGGMAYDESGCNPDADGDLCGVRTPTVWSSEDGAEWSTSPLTVGAGVPDPEPGLPDLNVTAVAGLVHSARGYVAVGAETGYDGARHETWVSDDGIEWIRLPQHDRPAFDLGPGLVAAGPAGVIGISATRAGDTATAWELR